jgi:NTE family protein
MNFKKIFITTITLGILILSGCSHLRMRSESEHAPSTPEAAPSPGPRTMPAPVPEITPEGTTQTPIFSPSVPAPPPPAIPKVAFIFGPGGARSYGLIGFLQEMQKHRVPVHAVGGIEWGAMVAAFYSLKGSLNDVEWQMAKIKADEIIKKSLVSGLQMNDVSVLKNFLNETISKLSVEQAKLPFACPAYNITKNQTYIMNKGPFTQLLPYCLAYPPLFKPYNSNVSAVREVRAIADYLRSQGANYVILVNTLGAPGPQKNITGRTDTSENLYWNEIAGFYSKPMAGVDQVVNLSLDGYSLFDFDRKRDIIQKGASSSNAWVQQFANRFGF